jgi:hypothetical protein
MRSIGRGDAVTSVLAGNHEGVARRLASTHQMSSGSWRKTCRVPSPHSLLSAVK